VEDKRESQRKAKRNAAPGTKEGKELVPLLYKANWETSGIFFFPSVNYNNIAICGKILTNLYISILKNYTEKREPYWEWSAFPMMLFPFTSTFGGLLLNLQI
jgi:hypothetical protein